MLKRKLATAAAATAAVASLTACTPRQINAWLDWHEKDPAAAEAFARQPAIQAQLHGRSSGASRAVAASHQSAGDCASFAGAAAAAGLPWGTFSRIAQRESGCNPNAWVHDHDDWGGGLFGLNFISQDLRNGWKRLCGATMDNIRGNVPLQMRCAAAAYREMGMRPWS